ncbi:S9 family peptidase [Umboniibacter marinipuniceus]|uniref:Oligopeptidase B n=1 Tax=Umboniibacter marinipuniceus TaxID=569599 RepID=A0A3M0ADP3_9GAMM|nr:S9 family peptidase [Umboniibacter marinipuniceus]RMA82656.1 oligopeptidase B [Umboniibacter marinipuniceus]
MNYFGLRPLALGIGAVFFLGACTPGSETSPTTMSKSQLSELPNAPYASQREHEFSHHGITVSDPWNWLRDSDYPTVDDQDVLDYLNAENAYFQSWLQPQAALTDTLFEEFKGRLDESESSVPWVSNGYEYSWVYEEGEEYRTYLRRDLSDPEAQAEVFLDQPGLAESYEYFVMGGYSVSDDNRYLAYSFDTSGDERYTVRVKDLVSGEYLDDVITDTNGSAQFMKDGSLVYGLLEEGKWRTQSINRYELDSNASTVLLVESDDSFFLGFGSSSDGEYLLLGSGQGAVSEYYALSQNNLTAKPMLLASRSEGFSYTVDHAHGDFWILANDQHVNFRMAKVADTNPSYENWETVIAGSDAVYLRSFQPFNDFIAIKQSVNGLEQIHVNGYDGSSHEIVFPEDVFTASIGNNPEFDQRHLRLSYSSMVTPSTVFDYQLDEQSLETRKVADIPSGYDKSRYETKRLMITARDGAEVPVSMLYLKGTELDGSNPLHLYGYGAYGSGMSPRFSTTNLSLVDRGVIYAIAHVRGGDEMGYQWYLDGKLEKRTNTFNDFIDVARGLIAQNYTAAGNISSSGRSAGGELMGAVVVQAPELWSSVILGVPFVDVLNTMLDATLPLTPPEWSEWGNPIEDKAAFELLQSYSPYDNIEARDYPSMLVTGGLNDPRVTYWEPAKWTAAMRHYKTDDNLLMMRMNMGAGHFANSGRYGRLRDYAEEYTFILMSHGITE